MSMIPLQPEARAVKAMTLLITTLMVVLAIAALSGAAALRHVDTDWRHTLTDSWTLELDSPEPGRAPSQAEIDKALAILGAIPGIKSVRPLGADELNRLLQSWLGDPSVLAQLPLPALIDIALDPDHPAASAAVALQLRASLPNARLDDHGAWTRDMADLARTGEAIGLAMLLIVTLTAMLAVAATARARLAVNRPEIELLHRIGASDTFIAKQFETGAFRSAVAGALLGAIIATAGGGALAALAPSVAPLALRLRLTPFDLAALAAVPVGFVALVSLVTRSTARSLLRSLT
jgi:cell division transport system permease protein